MKRSKLNDRKGNELKTGSERKQEAKEKTRSSMKLFFAKNSPRITSRRDSVEGDRLDSEQMRQHTEQERLESKQERLDREQLPYTASRRDCTVYSELGELGSRIASWRGRKENLRFVQREGKGWLASSYV